MPPPRSEARLAQAFGIALLALASLVSMNGCTSKADRAAASDAAQARDVTLTAAQLQHIHLYTVASSPFRKTVETTGTVDFDNDRASSVLAPFSGPVTRLLVSVGDKIAKGAPLALVDSPDFATAISGYRKAIATARTARRLADLEKDLEQHHGVSQREADQAQTDAVNAEADRDAALQALLALNVDSRTITDIREGRPIARIQGVIRSPIAGTVVEKLIRPGELLAAGSTACFTVADLSRLWVMAQIYGADLASVAVGDPAEISLGSGRTLPGIVTNLSPIVDPNTRSVEARIAVDNSRALLRKQMYVRVMIHSRRERNGLLVPVSAILRDDENLPFVYLADADGGFARRHVTLGYRSGDQYDIDRGLRPGDRVVVEGGIFLQFIQNQ